MPGIDVLRLMATGSCCLVASITLHPVNARYGGPGNWQIVFFVSDQYYGHCGGLDLRKISMILDGGLNPGLPVGFICPDQGGIVDHAWHGHPLRLATGQLLV